MEGPVKKWKVVWYGLEQKEELKGMEEINLEHMTPELKEYWIIKEKPAVLLFDSNDKMVFSSKGILTTKQEIRKIIKKGTVGAYRFRPPERQLTNDTSDETS